MSRRGPRFSAVRKRPREHGEGIPHLPKIQDIITKPKLSAMRERGDEFLYINYQDLSVEYDSNTYEFRYFCRGKQTFVSNGRIERLQFNDACGTLKEFQSVSAQHVNGLHERKLTITYSNGTRLLKEFSFSFVVNTDSIVFAIETNRPEVSVFLSGDILWGEDVLNSTFAMRLERLGGDIRAACGPAVSAIDNAVFDRLTDSAVEFTGADSTRLSFDWERKVYQFHLMTSGLGRGGKCRCTVHKNVYRTRHHVNYKPISKETQYKIPPVGWMTWYALQFDASEQTVLQNTRWMKENLRDFGAGTVWIDWEWHHSDMSGLEKAGIDTFHPNPERYPNGLKFVADEIREAGFIPAIWVGATNDTNRNEELVKNPGYTLCEDTKWCGNWWIDPTNPEVIRMYIPKIFNQLLGWGYEAFKWDCLPASLGIYDEYHDRFHDTSVNSEDALRGLVAAAREVIGENRYMISCSGESFRSVTFAMDLFDGGRIGGDVFSWHEFINFAFKNMLRYLCFNNITFYADPDNVVVRKEFNSPDEAISRATLVSVLGMPYTMGDNLPELNPERVDILKRTIPVLDIHPMDVNEVNREVEGIVLINLSIAKSFESWNVVSVFNPLDSDNRMDIDICRDLHLEEGKYLVFDYWNQTFLGVKSGLIAADLKPHQTRVFSLRKITGLPQIISTSRHVTGGGYDLENVVWRENRLHIASKVVKGDAYRVSVYLPEKYRLCGVSTGAGIEHFENGAVVTLMPAETGTLEWWISFEKED